MTHDPTPAPLADSLALEELGDDVFRGAAHSGSPGRRMFGGEVAAQALAAMQRTVPTDRPVHSMHGYFVLGGDREQPVDHRVTRTRDGGSFTTRGVRTRQDGGDIFVAMASFHAEESGFEHQLANPRLRAPEDSLTVDDVVAATDEVTRNWLAFVTGHFPWEFRFPATPPRPGDIVDGPRRTWFRARGPLAGDLPADHAAGLMHASDLFLLGAALQLHGLQLGAPDLFVTSLDHVVWFHAPFRIDDWLLYDQRSSWGGHGRALCRGRFFDRDGVLVATVAQEGLVRQYPRP